MEKTLLVRLLEFELPKMSGKSLGHWMVASREKVRESKLEEW